MKSQHFVNDLKTYLWHFCAANLGYQHTVSIIMMHKIKNVHPILSSLNTEPSLLCYSAL